MKVEARLASNTSTHAFGKKRITLVCTFAVWNQDYEMGGPQGAGGPLTFWYSLTFSVIYLFRNTPEKSYKVK